MRYSLRISATCRYDTSLGLTAATTDGRHFDTSSNNLSWVSFLESCQTVYFLVLLGISIEKLFVDVLLELRDLLDMWVILIVDVVCHEIDALEAPLDLT